MEKFKITLPKVLISSFLLLILSPSSWAQLSPSDAEALSNTTQLLKSQNQREAVIQKNPKAQEYVQKMQQMGMSEKQKAQTFAISADVFETLIKNQNGDSQAVQKLLLNAQKDPQAFYKSLPPETQRQIQSLSTEVEAIMTGKPPY